MSNLKEKKGVIAEKIVGNWASKKGYSVEACVDPYAPYDMLIDGVQTQVKAQEIFIRCPVGPSWTLSTEGKQSQNFRNAKKRYIVSNTHPKYPYKEYTGIWEILDGYIEVQTTRSNGSCIAIPYEQNKQFIRKVADLSKKDDGELQKYTDRKK